MEALLDIAPALWTSGILGLGALLWVLAKRGLMDADDKNILSIILVICLFLLGLFFYLKPTVDEDTMALPKGQVPSDTAKT